VQFEQEQSSPLIRSQTTTSRSSCASAAIFGTCPGAGAMRTQAASGSPSASGATSTR
jgi:hypothetical protein